jgi:RNA polymerase sigma-70 factor (ECF subfamily)
VTGHSIVDRASFEAAFVANFAEIHCFLARRVGTGLADDLAAETFAVAFRRRASFDSSRGTIRPWLFGIAIMLLRAHRRDERRVLALASRVASQPSSHTADIGDAATAAVLAPRLGDALNHLSHEQRDVLLLHAWGELSGDEIASALGMRAATVRSHLARARARLRRALDDSGNDHKRTSGEVTDVRA